MKLLVNCKDDFEAQLIEGLLTSAGIPVHKEYRGAGQIIKIYGGTGQDIDIYVPDDRLEEARQLLESGSELDDE
ncbi:MAG: DUF2007 domain-containing protein [Eubacteriales bacterium]|nr:DUF2007 domain-containing protein [Eubacteriales bacterium]MDD3073339.1 DUF2007 domain-containing protein [Eubacteriales bacterium]MDD4078456.1 DUF2007 domain-containing protein [Eubacteriales bacterium]MDD4769068.1 DUF2007 domain-containing protein [Eubacteriales bacterium]